MPTFLLSPARCDGKRAKVLLNPAATYPLSRERGQLRVLDRGRWISLSELAASVARLRQTLVIDVAAGEVRVRP